MDQTQAPISESEEIEESLCRTGGGRKVFRVGEWVGGCVVISHSLSLSLSLFFPPRFGNFSREKKGGNDGRYCSSASIWEHTTWWSRRHGAILLLLFPYCWSFLLFYPQLFLTDRIGSLGFSTSGRRSSELELWWCLNVILRP